MSGKASGQNAAPTADAEWDELVRDEQPRRRWSGGGIPHMTPSLKKRRAERERRLAEADGQEAKTLF